MIPIVLFHHSLFFLGTPPELRPAAFAIVREQMMQFQQSGLWTAASQIICGINGGEESEDYAALLIPPKARIVYHGLDSRAENLTIVEIEKWLKANPGEAFICYTHCKGATHDPNAGYADLANRWRRCGMRYCVENWQVCVSDLNSGYEAVGPHWMAKIGPDNSQSIFAGNFWWARASFLRTLPSIYERERIKVSGIANVESRYEAEVWIGNGPRLPNAKDYANHGLTGCP